jgi:large subunit ribosomal protein L17
MRGRKLGRNASHRKAMFRNMACSLIRSVREYPDLDEKERLERGLGYAPKVNGRITTTLPKAKELRPFVEKLITLARKAFPHEERASEYASSAERNSAEWKSWRDSEQWNQWNQAIAPAVAIRRRLFSMLRDKEAVDILFDELVSRFQDRPGGYTRVVRLAKVRLGDAGRQALIEFVDEQDRVRVKRQAPVVSEEPDSKDRTEPFSEPESDQKGQVQTAEAPEESASETEVAPEADSESESTDEK